MPLLEMSHNIQSRDLSGNGIVGLANEEAFQLFPTLDDKLSIDPVIGKAQTGLSSSFAPALISDTLSTLPALKPLPRQSTPAQSSPASLTDAGSSTPARDSPSPNLTPTRPSPALAVAPQQGEAAGMTQMNASATVAEKAGAKRKRRTAAEIEAEEKEKALKKQKREEEKAAKDKLKADEKAEKEARLKEKQAEKDAKDAEKQAKAKERDEKRRQKEEAERLEKEKKLKKEQSQLKLSSFFGGGAPSTPKKTVTTAATSNADTPSKESPLKATPKQTENEVSEYERRFKPFFVKSDVRLASLAVDMDEETRETKSRILDEYISGQRATECTVRRFDPVEIFHLPKKPCRRGRLHVPVKHTMEKQAQLLERSEHCSGEAQRKVLEATRDALSKVPVKILHFREDVRPPYRGTVTLKPFQATEQRVRSLARRPTAPILDLNYDYDSEREWQDDEGEDVDDLDDDDDDDPDDEDNMDGFLDDSEDAGPARALFANGMEPESTGLCFENRKGLGPVATVYKHRMELILESLDQHSGIDPFSTQYWDPQLAVKVEPTSAPVPASKATLMPPPPGPANAFQALGTGKPGKDDIKLVPDEDLPKFKSLVIEHQKLSKVGLTDLLSHAFDHITKKQVENTLKLVAEKPAKRGVWALKAGHEL